LLTQTEYENIFKNYALINDLTEKITYNNKNYDKLSSTLSGVKFNLTKSDGFKLDTQEEKQSPIPSLAKPASVNINTKVYTVGTSIDIDNHFPTEISSPLGRMKETIRSNLSVSFENMEKSSTGPFMSSAGYLTETREATDRQINITEQNENEEGNKNKNTIANKEENIVEVRKSISKISNSHHKEKSYDQRIKEFMNMKSVESLIIEKKQKFENDRKEFLSKTLNILERHRINSPLRDDSDH
jgi:hypothetical protein